MIDELRAVIRAHEASRPRSMQVTIGPSEAGTPCARRLAYKLLEVEPVNTDTDPWAAIVGTSVHAWLDDAFKEANERAGEERWLTDLRVELPGYMHGRFDLYDKKHGTVIDHKVMGATSFKKFKKDGPSTQYRTQVHLYAAGLTLQGANVRNVGIAAWSRSGLLRDSIYWEEPYDEQIVETALARIDALRNTITALGANALAAIPTADAFCMYCPYYLPGSTEPHEACSGHVAGTQPNKEGAPQHA